MRYADTLSEEVKEKLTLYNYLSNRRLADEDELAYIDYHDEAEMAFDEARDLEEVTIQPSKERARSKSL
jgi:hypothetical protein